jgi:hypothetical protein
LPDVIAGVGFGVALLGMMRLWDVTIRKAWGRGVRRGVWGAYAAAVAGVLLMVLAWCWQAGCGTGISPSLKQLQEEKLEGREAGK